MALKYIEDSVGNLTFKKAVSYCRPLGIKSEDYINPLDYENLNEDLWNGVRINKGDLYSFHKNGYIIEHFDDNKFAWVITIWTVENSEFKIHSIMRFDKNGDVLPYDSLINCFTMGVMSMGVADDYWKMVLKSLKNIKWDLTSY